MNKGQPCVWKFSTPSIYLNGHPFHEFLTNGALHRIEAYLGHGLCYETAAIIMLALRNDKSAKLIQGYARCSTGELTEHAWVELRQNGVDYVISPNWLDNYAVPRSVFYDRDTEDVFFSPQPEWICGYRHFWNQRITKELYQFCSRSESSYGLAAFRFFRPDDNRLFYSDRKFGFILNDLPESHGLYENMSRGVLNVCGGGYPKPLSSEVVEDLFSGKDAPSVESLKQYKVKRHWFIHRALPLKAT